MVFSRSRDTYWHLPNEVGADFARMRELEDGRTQITVKAEDRGNSIDRMEIDVETFTSPYRVQKLIQAMIGRHASRLEKEYYVYWIRENDHTTISCYHISGTPPDLVYIEVESTEINQVLALETKVLEKFADVATVGRASGSLYDMYVRGWKNV